MPGRRACSATTSCARPTPCALVSLTGQLASVDEDLTGHENLVLLGRLLGLRKRATPARAAGCSMRSGSRTPPAGWSRTTRAACAAGSTSPRASCDARAHVPRRADHRARPALAQPGVGHRPRARGRRDDDPALHAVPRRGRPAGRRDRRDRPRQGDRRGNAGAAQGLGRLGRAARAAARPGPAARRPSACWTRARDGTPRARPGGAVGALQRRRPRAEAVAELSRSGVRSPASRSASRASTRCSSPSPATRPRDPAGRPRRAPRSRREHRPTTGQPSPPVTADPQGAGVAARARRGRARSRPRSPSAGAGC